MSELPEVISVKPSRSVPIHTTRSWEFLGLNYDQHQPTGLLRKSNFGDGVIIGVVDTGKHRPSSNVLSTSLLISHRHAIFQRQHRHLAGIQKLRRPWSWPRAISLERNMPNRRTVQHPQLQPQDHRRKMVCRRHRHVAAGGRVQVSPRLPRPRDAHGFHRSRLVRA